MSNPLKLGKLYKYFDRKCIICGKEEDYKLGNFITCWLCKDCENKTKFKIKDLIWFVHYNKSLDKLEILCGTIINFEFRRLNTYRVEYHKFDEPFKICEVKEEYIFKTREEAENYGKKLMEVAEEIQIQDQTLMKKQDKLYKQIKEFLESNSAIKFNVTGIDIKIENGYVNAEWKFGDRKKGDIIQNG